MDYGFAALTAILTFISPCVLPLLPVYVSYFMANEEGGENIAEISRKKSFFSTLFKVLAFCLGITVFFIAIFTTAAFAGDAFGDFIQKYRSEIDVVCGLMLILFGLKFMGYLSIPFLDKSININAKTKNVNVINAFVLGLVFSLSMGPCALGFTGFSLINTITSGSFLKAMLIGVIFTATLDILFIICALFIDQLKGFFSFIKRHYRIINLISGGLLVVLGLLMALGLLLKWLGNYSEIDPDVATKVGGILQISMEKLKILVPKL